MKGRIASIDFLKCLFIVLMVIFHLAYFADRHLYAKQVVYTFHMSGFLILSGYLTSIHKPFNVFGRSVLWFFIPYAIMEVGYVCMASVLPVRESVGGELSVGLLALKLFVCPMGPYWYLHTLIVCQIGYYLVFRLLPTWSLWPRLMILGLLYYGCSRSGMWLDWGNTLYFLAGCLIAQAGWNFSSVFSPSWWSVLPFVLCVLLSPEGMYRFTLQGVMMTWLSISIALALHRILPRRVCRLPEFIGRNTLVILLFSPVFTMLSKSLIPFLSFDSGGWIFMIVATCLTLFGSLMVAWGMDKLRLSRYFFGRERIVV